MVVVTAVTAVATATTVCDQGSAISSMLTNSVGESSEARVEVTAGVLATNLSLRLDSPALAWRGSRGATVGRDTPGTWTGALSCRRKKRRRGAMWERLRKAKRDHSLPPPPRGVLALLSLFVSGLRINYTQLFCTAQEAALSNIKIAPAGRVARLYTVQGTRLSLSL